MTLLTMKELLKEESKKICNINNHGEVPWLFVFLFAFNIKINKKCKIENKNAIVCMSEFQIMDIIIV